MSLPRDTTMHVLLDCRMAEWTGVGRYTQGLVRALAQRDDLRLTCVVARGAGPVAKGPAVDALVDATRGPFSLGGMVEFSRIARSADADVVHCLHFPTPLPAVHPLVVTLHDLTPLLIEGSMPSAPKRAIYRALSARAARVADLIVAPSSHTAADVERMFPAAAGKTRVTLEGADDFASGPLGDLPVVAKQGPYVFSMGSTRAHKDLPTLLRAFVCIAAEYPDVRLLLAGKGDPAYLVAHLAEAPADVRARVAFTGRVDDDQLRALYAGAAAFAFPSRYEGFGLPPLEAMALGTPVVCSDAASLPEVVGDAGLLFPAGDDQQLAERLRAILCDGSLRERLASAGRARAARLTWAAAAEKTVAVYREACW